MVDRQHREDWKRKRSLLALGQAMRGEEEPSLVSLGDRADPSWREDAATRHRLARSRREGRAHPEFSAIPEPSAIPERPITPEFSASDETSQFQADHASASTARIPPETDDAVDAGYADARLREEPFAAGASEDRRSDADPRHAAFDPRYAFEPRYPASDPRYATFEPQYAGDEQRSSREADGGWKPLIDPMQVVRGVAGSKLLIVTMTILGATLGVAIALSTPKKYDATAELIVDPRDLKLTDRDLTQSVVASDATLAIVENQVRVLTSGTVLNKVVDKLNLVNDPEFNGQGTDGLGVMTLIRSILSRNDGPGADEGRRRALAVTNLAESLSVERGGKTFVISVSATTQNGEKSALIANTMTDVFLQTFGQIQSDTAGRATHELTGRLDELRKGVEVAERKVAEFRAAHDLVDAQGHLISDDEMLKLNQQLAIARARTLELNARAASARSIDVNSVLSGTLPEEINSNTMSELRSQYATLKQEADRAAIRFGPRHPELQALNAQLAGSRERIAGELRRIASSLQVDLRRAVQLEQDLASRLAQLKVRSGDVNSDLVTLRELEREAAAKRSVYEQYLLRAKETGEQKDINTANINVISKAFAPLEPNGPSRAVTVLAGLLAGLASGVGLGAMRGAYASLRETANSRPGRRTDERGFGDQAYQASPPRVPPVEATRRSGPISALLSAVSRIVPRKARREDSAATWSSGSPASGGASTVAGGAKRDPETTGYRQPQVQQGAYAPQQAMYPAPPMQAHAQPPMGYSWQMQPPPAGYPYSPAMAPHAGPYPQQPVYPRASSDKANQASDAAEQQASIEEIRASLREFREAVRELTESRSRRYF
ncbi:GumC family protein [Mesorhizobium sp.]|uniref:GumC family protein n=1 Tax=Mesorhizobium sp. TaxID=1871066 RepID=UPI000FEA5E6A|nr:GumC family protein [Mesorhizobium sp.]RWK62937.1 MAG: succinoglycan biosynthesis protein exop [Mesorhizobium sp.]RWM49815.1 MAG: succinoglycan biosynthesis protein exop [Mesorhizobium sp.]RWM55190.1 MAG: succinoglycan biosynthesis protein exop [Mesorhizobium sp.]RWM56213.1 MAG: succinoglycan biosynthesis protein exop [Mesorhizobium sp.]RWN01802.1 MAG: succinoglycan biosynthesis protein exop [Mesorhizobium sp.]